MSHFDILLFSIILLVLLILTAFFSCAETGLMAVNRYRLRHQARLKKRFAIRLLQLLKRPDRLLGAILIGSTFANMLASSLATLIAFHLWGDEGGVLAAIIMAFVVLIFGEITPKTLAALYPEKIARWVVYPVQWLLKLLSPAVWLANGCANSILRIFRVPVTSHALEPLSREELRSIVYDTSGKIPRQYQNMLLGILDLNKLSVDDVMIPRHEIQAVDINESWENILKMLNHFHQEWIPFYRGNTNQMIGILYTKDVLSLFLKLGNHLNKQTLEQLLQEPYFVPEGTALNIQLGHFQRTHDKIAFVVDEYGEILGLLTLNDILEEIVGDFTSSMSLEKRFQRQPDGSYLADGALTVREFNRVSEWELPLRGPRTISGLIVEHLEALPHAGTTVLIAHYPIEVIEVKDNRVKQACIFPRLTKQKDHS